MPRFVCVTCGVEYPDSDEPPVECLICNEPRQYVPPEGQSWTTLDELQADHANTFHDLEPGLTAIHTEPAFAIGQHAHLVQAGNGDVLWDCITLLDPQTRVAIEERGGLTAIALSHPHYYSTILEWSEAFGGVLVYVHEADEQWLVRRDGNVVLWSGETHELGRGLTLVRCGGHFEGGAVLHWAQGAEGRGALLSGDIVQVVLDRDWVSFMYSYPNFIPLPAETIRRIVAALEPYEFDQVYGAWWDAVVRADGKAAIVRSAERYLRAIGAA